MDEFFLLLPPFFLIFAKTQENFSFLIEAIGLK